MTPSSPDSASDGAASPRIRTATQADVPAIACLILRLAVHDGVAPPVVAESPDGSLAGVLQVSIRLSTWEAAPYAYLEDFFVDEPFRGRGTGSALLARAVEIARERGCVRIDLDVLTASDAARAFYARHGFVDQQRRYLRRAL